MNELLIESALTWVGQGIGVIPIKYRSKKPDPRLLENGAWGKYQETLPTEDDINRWFSNGLHNLAIICGWENLIIVDFDSPHAEALWLNLYGHYSDTYTVTTCRGHHYYYYCNELPEHGLKWVGGDVKSIGGYCLAPPSVHPTGHKYTIAYGAPVMHIDSIYDVLPEGVFQYDLPATNVPRQDPFSILPPVSRWDEINQQKSIMMFFPDTPPQGRNNFVNVPCPFHDDHRASAWVDVKRNRFGCHKCINGSISVIDFFSMWQGLPASEAAAILCTI